jgi:hypothetical protein
LGVLAHLSNRGLTLKAANAILLVSLVLFFSIPPALSTSTSQFSTIMIRAVPLTIKIVFVGFDPNTIDQDYLNWKGNLIQSSVNNVLGNGNLTGVDYSLTYDFFFTSAAFQQSLTKYLQSIQVKKLTYNPWFRTMMTNYFYDADKVQSWLVNNNASYGGFPSNGDVFVFTNMTTLPSLTSSQLETDNPTSATPHYYSEHFTDLDLNYSIRYRDFSVAWGGDSRLWFVDMSAGPDFWTWSTPESVPFIPMQLALDLYQLNLHTSNGKEWLTQYLADYIYDAVLNLAVPVFVYQPIYSHTYRFVVNVIDNRTDKEKDAVAIKETLHPEIVRSAFVDLMPYSDIVVEAHFINASDDPGLQAAIIQSTVSPPVDLGISPYVDTRPLYRYLQEHLTDFVGTVRKDSTESTVPVFAFAFSSGIYFGYTYKWYVATSKTIEDSFVGISLGDMSLIGMTQNDFQKGDSVSPAQPGKGTGFTQSVIHEAGHSLGLIHPHQFSYLEDFVASAMSYWSWVYKFSQFDKDALNRAHADELINSALANVTEAQQLSGTSFDFGLSVVRADSARNLLNSALEKYNSMNYIQAVEIAAVAAQEAGLAKETAVMAPNGVVSIGLISLTVGIVIGSSLIFMAFRRYAHEIERTGTNA